MSNIDVPHAIRCWTQVAQPANQLGDQPAITLEQFSEILAAIVGFADASDKLIGDVSNWKPTGFLAGFKDQA